MATVIIEIPKWRPARLNEYIGRHWSVGAKMKKHDKTIVFAHSANKPKAEGKRRVDLHIVLSPRQKEADGDAYAKSCLDALVHCGMLKDDTVQLAEWGTVSYSRGEPKTIITLIDL